MKKSPKKLNRTNAIEQNVQAKILHMETSLQKLLQNSFEGN